MIRKEQGVRLSCIRYPGAVFMNCQVTMWRDGDIERISFSSASPCSACGPKSGVTRSVYPDYRSGIPWFMVGQKFQRIIECPLDRDYFHFWFHPGLGHYTWSHERNAQQIVGVGFPAGGNLHIAHKNVERYLADKHAVILEPAEKLEGCVQNFRASSDMGYVPSLSFCAGGRFFSAARNALIFLRLCHEYRRISSASESRV